MNWSHILFRLTMFSLSCLLPFFFFTSFHFLSSYSSFCVSFEGHFHLSSVFYLHDYISTNVPESLPCARHPSKHPGSANSLLLPQNAYEASLGFILILQMREQVTLFTQGHTVSRKKSQHPRLSSLALQPILGHFAAAASLCLSTRG